MITRSYLPAPYWPSPYAATAPAGTPIFTGSFSDAGISNIIVYLDVTDLYVSWTTDTTLNPPGTYYQVYVNGILKSSDISTSVTIPGIQSNDQDLVIHVGKVSASNRYVDYSGTLSGLNNRAGILWYGGSWVDTNLVGYHIYMSSEPDGPVNRDKAIASIPANTGGDDWGGGYGRGPYGRGSYGRNVIEYDWTSDPLRSGRWYFEVASYDSAGNLSPQPWPSGYVDVIGPPSSPPEIDGRKIWVDSFDEVNRTFVVRWNP